jgi:hypothetical protein
MEAARVSGARGLGGGDDQWVPAVRNCARVEAGKRAGGFAGPVWQADARWATRPAALCCAGWAAARLGWVRRPAAAARLRGPAGLDGLGRMGRIGV